MACVQAEALLFLSISEEGLLLESYTAERAKNGAVRSAVKSWVDWRYTSIINNDDPASPSRWLEAEG